MSKSPWPTATAANRWYAFGRYYAMFPPTFVHDAISSLTKPGEFVVDPFCGRGNAPFTAAVLGRPSLSVDINPLAWLYTIVKLEPEPDVIKVLSRLNEIGKARRKRDEKAESEFEAMAWNARVRSFLKAARRELNWADCRLDRTLTAFVALHMQDKIGAGLSNELSPTLGFSPSYAVRWWSKRGWSEPPMVDPIELLTAKIRRRYRYGVTPPSTAKALLGDAAQVLPTVTPVDGSLLITSPPYNGVTDYWNDHWIRLWLLGYEMRKDWTKSQRSWGNEQYYEMLRSVFAASKEQLDSTATILVRSDRRANTAAACLAVLREVWPNRIVWQQRSDAPYVGVSNEHGRGGSKAKEMDYILPGNEHAMKWARSEKFKPAE